MIVSLDKVLVCLCLFEKVVYVFGAGFSAPLGLPVMSNFIEKSKDMYFSDETKYIGFDKIFRYFAQLSNLKSYYESDLLNIEEVLSIIETIQITESLDIREELINYIKRVINQYMPKFSKLSFKDKNWNEQLFSQSGVDEFKKAKIPLSRTIRATCLKTGRISLKKLSTPRLTA